MRSNTYPFIIYFNQIYSMTCVHYVYVYIVHEEKAQSIHTQFNCKIVQVLFSWFFFVALDFLFNSFMKNVYQKTVIHGHGIIYLFNFRLHWFSTFPFWLQKCCEGSQVIIWMCYFNMKKKKENVHVLNVESLIITLLQRIQNKVCFIYEIAVLCI